MTVKSTPEQLCAAKMSVAVERRRLAGAEQLNYSCSGRCPGCSREAEAGVTVEQAKADMELFMDRVLEVDRSGEPFDWRTRTRPVSFLDPGPPPTAELVDGPQVRPTSESSVTESSSSLSELIHRVRLEKTGDRDFALHSLFDEGDDRWRATVGNPSSHVMLGEVDGEFTCDASTPELAVWGVLKLVRESTR